MSVPLFRCVYWVLGTSATLALTACGSFDNASHQVASMVTPYKMEIVQGNFVSKEQVSELQPGMTRQQVREILGTPLVVSVFHADRWDYVFTLKRQGVAPQARKLVVFFKDNQLERFEGDEMPSEADFVEALDRRTTGKKAPVLEASPESLEKFAPANKAAAAAPAPILPPLPSSYPPLESPTQ